MGRVILAPKEGDMNYLTITSLIFAGIILTLILCIRNWTKTAEDYPFEEEDCDNFEIENLIKEKK